MMIQFPSKKQSALCPDRKNSYCIGEIWTVLRQMTFFQLCREESLGKDISPKRKRPKKPVRSMATKSLSSCEVEFW